ncbi:MULTISPECIES: glucose PTS transporter subunit IIA [unclassified Lactococcus]|uniref:PTS sugar transporter subunit IIA n=1 Tax=unclassified Lactococcus TaxID=2643510 RepID=UPI0011C901C5|nr:MULTISPECIES: glucose PTS transporter subunit IIA [unclassified Lactococcus]MQW22059.1 PTS glucose transporter subunit IIA [Lactococcus sp. dk101]TXK45002.1 PTS glucose transporter subunit IIA [Lactococcus sp. dk310]TXK51217.1 PTS glucose transporter subunit IIA [Lactococcus sp. dk322]
MFGFGKKKIVKADKILYSPFDGHVFKMEEVTDPVFSKKILGDGFALSPESSVILAPVAAKVVLVEGHAIGFVRADGLEVLLHLGIDTVNLAGLPFQFSVKKGDVVEGGQEIGQVDWQAVEKAGYEKTTLILFTNANQCFNSFDINYGDVKAGTPLGAASVK